MDINRLARRVGVATAVLALGAAAAVAPSASAATRSVPRCTTADLSAKQTNTGAGMSQPTSTITLTNTSGSRCKLKGFPTITGASSSKGAVKISAGHATGMQNAPQTKPRKIILAPGGQAFFSVGTATAFDPPLVNLTSVTYATTPGGPTATVKIQLGATAPTGKPIPMGVTAYGAGADPFQS